ncbi:hypothetical protein [Paenibacillus sp. NPDC093718]|uniref:hypothetical protein n=1 Tax=Paenibacillus sp. NPDC093718 TaxID=3390601 RepID=UPI003D03369D
MPSLKRKDDFVVYVVTLSNMKRYFSIEFIGGTCGYIIGQRGLHSDIFGMLGSMAAPMAIRAVLQWQAPKPKRATSRKRHALLFLLH